MCGGFKDQTSLGCNFLSGLLRAPRLAGKPFGLKTPLQDSLPEASEDTQDLSSAPSSPKEEETNAQLEFLFVGLKPDTVSILCYDSYGSENYFRTKASGDWEAEKSLAPKSKCFPWFLGGVVGGSWHDKVQQKLPGWKLGYNPAKPGGTGSTSTADTLTHYQHGAPACSWWQMHCRLFKRREAGLSSAIAWWLRLTQGHNHLFTSKQWHECPVTVVL